MDRRRLLDSKKAKKFIGLRSRFRGRDDLALERAKPYVSAMVCTINFTRKFVRRKDAQCNNEE